MCTWFWSKLLFSIYAQHSVSRPENALWKPTLQVSLLAKRLPLKSLSLAETKLKFWRQRATQWKAHPMVAVQLYGSNQRTRRVLQFVFWSLVTVLMALRRWTGSLYNQHLMGLSLEQLPSILGLLGRSAKGWLFKRCHSSFSIIKLYFRNKTNANLKYQHSSLIQRSTKWAIIFLLSPYSIASGFFTLHIYIYFLQIFTCSSLYFPFSDLSPFLQL